MSTINRRQFIQGSAVALLAASCPSWVEAAMQAGSKFSELRGGIGIFTARGGTIAYLMDPKGMVFVDSQFEKSAKVFLAEMQKRGTQPMEYLLNTHHHGDHTGGNAVLRPVVKKIVGHKQVPVLQRMQSKQRKLPAPTVPDTLFDKSWKTTVGQETIHMRHHGPAHTSGDSVVTFEKANIAHLGDLVFHERFPYIDPPAGASISNWVKVLEKTLNNHDAETLYIFGHSKPGTAVTGKSKDVKRFQSYLSSILSHVEKGLSAGHSKQEILSLKQLKGFESYIGSGPMSLNGSLKCAYDELVNAKKKVKPVGKK